MDRSAANHYPAMEVDAIAALQLPAAPDAVWSTVSQLEAALRVIRDWEFEYRSAHGWAKPRLGTGYWVRDNLELLLIAIRGKPPAPAPGTQLPSLIEAPQGEHSAKPPAFAEYIERMPCQSSKCSRADRRGQDGPHGATKPTRDRLMAAARSAIDSGSGFRSSASVP